MEYVGGWFGIVSSVHPLNCRSLYCLFLLKSTASSIGYMEIYGYFWNNVGRKKEINSAV